LQDADEENVSQDEERKEQENDEEVEENAEEEQQTDAIRRQRKCSEYFWEYVLLTYKEAVTGPDKEKWEEAINEEKNSLKENKTWEVIDLKKLKEEKPLTRK